MATPDSDEGGGRRRWVVAITGVLSIGAATAAILAAAPEAAAAPSGSGCVAATSGAQVHFLVDFAAADPAISGLTITGFDQAACDGLPVTVVISGNPAGDPGQAASELLTTLDSTRDPCTNAKLGAAVTVSGGTVTLHGCSAVADPGRAAYASLHDATQLTVAVSGAVLPVVVGPPVEPPPTGSTVPPPGGSSSVAATSAVNSSSLGIGGVSTHASDAGGSEHSGQGGGTGPLASTGVRIAVLVGFALLLIVVGLLVLVPARRRHHG